MLISPADFTDTDLTLPYIKNQLELLMQKQKAQFLQDQSCTQSLLLERSDYMDALLSRLWHQLNLDQENISLFAVGGYGRKELHPLSDIDLLLLSKNPLSTDIQQKIGELITKLWDLKLVIGHSVRTLQDCIDIGMQDLTVATSLQEARLIIGNPLLEKELKQRIFASNFWPSIDFFHAKVAEQETRHARFNDTAYNLEPDIKSSPGGLRDIHNLHWIAHRHFGSANLRDMSKYGFLTHAEYEELKECQHFLWRMRFALHLLLKRADNRLTFAHQQEVADLLGFQGNNNAAVEQMMKGFYRTLGRVTELNQILICLFAKQIATEKTTKKSIELCEYFQRTGSQIEARDSQLFNTRPEQILGLFIHIAREPLISSIAAGTLRQLSSALRAMTQPLSLQDTARKKFVALIKEPNVLSKAIPLMHKHGIFSAYLPQWNQIVGQMQFDLFHAYTVDEHTIRLLKHINRFSKQENKSKHPICYELWSQLAKSELLILAAIFHDIAKGRGGDHSEMGAIDAFDFCIQHGFSDQEAKLVSWLVEKHLLMSVTAQRRDIYDPKVIDEFAQEVASKERLDYLICLTVADICATNPSLWNSWKRTLISELYHATLNALQQEGQKEKSIFHVKERIRENKQRAREELLNKGVSELNIDSVWQPINADYFLRHDSSQIAWHTEQILQHNSFEPLVVMKNQDSKGSTEIFIYARDKASLFAHVVDALDRKNLSVHGAQIVTNKNGFTLDTFIVLDSHNHRITKDRHQQIIDTVVKALNGEHKLKASKRATPTKFKAFHIEPKVNFLPSESQSKTLIELIALDTPGLLAKIGGVFDSLTLSLQAAKITTIGERAEDFFIVCNKDGQALNEEEKRILHTALLEVVDVSR